MKLRQLRGFLIGILLTSCNLAPAAAPLPTATGIRLMPATLAAAAERGLQTAPTRPQTPEPLADSAVCTPSMTRHLVDITLSYANKTADVQHTLYLTNPLDEPTQTLVFAVEPNRTPGAFVLRGAAASSPIAAVEVVGRRLVLELEQPLASACSIEVSFSYGLTLPQITPGSGGFGGYFGHSTRQINLGHALLTLAHHDGAAWITHDVTVIGEQGVSAAADWDVTLNVTERPDGLTLAAPGRVRAAAPGTWQIVAEGNREVALSLSPFFRVAQAFSENGVRVEVYSFENAIVDTPTGRIDGAEQALAAAVQSLATYSDLYGPYQAERLVVVQGDFPDGMEFSGLAFVGDQWFRTNPGTPESYLTIITVHEVAHQWWYARVGNDPALIPWLDEALATYSEYVFYEEYYPELTDWWWAFRVRTFLPANYTGRPVDSTVYEFASAREYINAVYLRGADMLHQMRGALGTEAFFAWLRRYSEMQAGRVANTGDIWSALSQDEQTAIQLLRDTFTHGD